MLTSCVKEVKQSPDLNINETSLATRSENPVAIAASDRFVSNEILVKFKRGASESSRGEALGLVAGTVKEKVQTKAMKNLGDEGFYLVHIPAAVLEAVGKLKGFVDVEFAEPNYIYTHSATSNDAYYTNGSLWGMYGSATSPANQFGSQAGTAWTADHTGNASVYIGIIDEGVMVNHEDLGNFKNPGEIGGIPGSDDDGNGFIDDLYGWDFVNNDNSVFDGVDDDHGTHVAGTIGAKGGNGKGVAGVNWNVTLISAKFLGTSGGTTANAIKAIDYFTNLKTENGVNIVATNNSWGGGGYSQALYDAIARANNADILFIAAAGNNGLNTENSPSYPSGYNNPNIIAVASITSTGALSSFSNYAVTKVDIGAPGSGIFSTLPVRSKGKIASTYGSYSGTSMATPHVAGAAALYLAYNPGASAATIKEVILNSAIPTPSLAGKCLTGGRLNVSGF
jgi:subtilisin family serine protease